MDGVQHLFVLEGLAEGAILRLWQELPKPHNSGISIIYIVPMLVLLSE